MYVGNVNFTDLCSVLVFHLKLGMHSFLLESVTLEGLPQNGNTFESCREMETCLLREVSFIIIYITFSLCIWCTLS